jgi:hypothetical protein
MQSNRKRNTSAHRVSAATRKLRQFIPEDVPIEKWAADNGIGRSTVFRLLSGKRVNVSRKTALLIEKATDGLVTVEDWDL